MKTLLTRLRLASRRFAGDRFQRWATAAATFPLGRKHTWRGELGLQQRWYVSQPTQRIVVSVLERREAVARDALAIATRALCARHPSSLGVCTERSLRRLSTRPLRADDPLPWFNAPPADVWTLATAMLHQPFATEAPLFRVALASDGKHVVAAFDHLVADGVSAGIFAAELGALLAGDPLPPVPEDGAVPLDARLDVRPSLSILKRALRGVTDPRVLLVPRDTGAIASKRTAVVAVALSRELVDTLALQARRCAVSLHAVLSAAALSAALEALEVGRGALRLTTPISLRDRCQPVPKGIGVFISGVDTELEVSRADDLWKLARRVRDDIAQKRPDAHRTVGLLKFAGDLRSLALKYERTAHGRTATVEVSNIGRVTGIPHGAAAWLTQGAHYHAALFVLTVATSESDGALRCCLSYPEPLVDNARAARFMQAVERALDAMRASAP